MRRARASISIALTTALIGLAVPALALAHAELRTTVPAADERLAAGPDEVVLVFDGELDADGSSFTVTTESGAVVGEGGVDLTVPDRNEMRGSVSATDPGTYAVEWRSRSVDGHQERGEFTFDVATASPDTAARMPGSGAWPAAAGGFLLVVATALARQRAIRRRPA